MTSPKPGAIFVSYNGLLDPLGASQVLPYVERLAKDRPMSIVSFERQERMHPATMNVMRERLLSQGIVWRRLTYRRQPSLFAKALDLWDGVRAVRGLLTRQRSLIHARGYVSMEIASRATRAHPILFDIRGLQGEEYVDAGHWTTHDVRYLLLKTAERRFFRRAAGAVVLTKAIEPYVREKFAHLGRTPPLEVIPSAVALDRFYFDQAERDEVRNRLNLEDRLVFVYSGSLGSWYLADEMAGFVRAFADRVGRSVALLWLVNGDQADAERASLRARLTRAETRIATATASEMRPYLAAADVGLALIKACFSKRSSSPTKYGEYLAVGMPVVMTREVGDSALLESWGGGIAVDHPLDEGRVGMVCDRLVHLIQRPRAHFRAIAYDHFDIETVAIPAYRRLYEELLSTADG